jgi:glucosyl-3-phosphoglycerate synthase
VHHSRFRAERLAAERRESVSVCVPALNEAETIEPIVRDLVDLMERGAIDQVLVVDGGSTDDTPDLARRAGAEVRPQAQLLPHYGPVLGKGDAMWRALTAMHGDIVVFVDGDSGEFGPHFACGLAGPLLFDPEVAYVKGYYRRPFKIGNVTLPEGGGRVTELTARPLLELFFPELAAIRQPLAGEMAARRDLLTGLPFTTGYGVEIALLIDVYREIGIEAIAEVDLDVRQNRHQPIQALGEMAGAVARAVLARAGVPGIQGTGVVRPPLAHTSAGIPARL